MVSSLMPGAWKSWRMTPPVVATVRDVEEMGLTRRPLDGAATLESRNLVPSEPTLRLCPPETLS